MIEKLKLIDDQYLGLMAGVLYGSLVLYFYFLIIPYSLIIPILFIILAIVLSVISTMFLFLHELTLKEKIRISAGLGNVIGGLLLTGVAFITLIVYQRYSAMDILFVVSSSIIAFFGTLMLELAVFKMEKKKIEQKETFSYENL